MKSYNYCWKIKSVVKKAKICKFLRICFWNYEYMEYESFFNETALA